MNMNPEIVNCSYVKIQHMEIVIKYEQFHFILGTYFLLNSKMFFFFFKESI